MLDSKNPSFVRTRILMLMVATMSIIFSMRQLFVLQGLLKLDKLFASCNHPHDSPTNANNKDRSTSATYEPLVLESMPENVPDALIMLKALRSSQQQKVTLVQIGANDGQMYDHLYKTIKDDKSSYLGLFVEPQPELCSKLAVLHADAVDWAFYAGVLAPTCRDGIITFCETKTPGVGNFKTQGQLNGVRDDPSACKPETMHLIQRPCESSWTELISRHASPSMRERVFVEDRHQPNGIVDDGIMSIHRHNTSSTTTTTASCGVVVVDMIVTDTEGQDLALLQMIDFEKLKPTCYLYEDTYLGRDGGRRSQQAHNILQRAGYSIRELQGDTLACRVAA